jgi:hypothetical protein
MKKILVFTATILMLAACQESLEQRAQRTLKEYSDKNCPQQITETIILDSCAFETDTQTLHYYYTFMGPMDNDSIATKGEAMRSLLLESVKNDPTTRIYKEAGYSFKYTYFSQKHRNLLRFETIITAKDYQN